MLYCFVRLRLQKRTSINSQKIPTTLHKEKEMADFRKGLLAFAVVALLASFAVPASAQSTANLQCTFNAAVTPTVRAEGLTELVGDIVLDCTGGTSTAFGATVPQANITVFTSTNLTSRLTSSPFTEVLLLIDEPHSAKNPGVALLPCDPGGSTLGVCSISGNGSGVNLYSDSAHPNVYQARTTGVNQVTFFGVPIDPPGTSGHRIIRITNIRGNANQLGVSSTLVPTQIVANISVNPPNLLPLNNPQQTVAFVARGLVTSVQSAVKFIQCISANPDIAADPTKAINVAATGNQNGQQFGIRFDEGFPSAWKEKNIQTHLSNTAGGIASPAYPADSAQDVPGANYFSESGFEVNGVTPVGATPNGYGPFLTANAAFPSTRGLNLAGTANAGTRLYLNFGAVPNGTQIFVPLRVNLVIPAASSAISGFAVLTSTDANGGGGLSPATGSVTNNTSAVTITGGTGLAVYEILFTDPFNTERMTVPIAVAFVANAGNNLPQPALQSTISTGFAPLSNVGTISDTAPIPRFAPSQTPLNTLIINKCSCNILFPFVTNQQGFDTGVAISNTSVDPFGTTPQAGLVTLNYYSGGTPPPAQTTNATVPGGQQLLFTLSGGGNFGIAATPGFQGYIIATAQFQFCHAFAYVSAQGALPTAAGASEGYLGIILDVPGLNRTGQTGEVQAH
jgi:hypothetical protein